MATGRKLTEKEKELFEENDFLKSQLESERKSNTVLLDLMTYNDLLAKAKKYEEQSDYNIGVTRKWPESVREKFRNYSQGGK